MPDTIKCPTGGPKMLWVFKGRIAKSTQTGIFVNFDTMPSEPSMSSEKLNEMAECWATKLEDFSSPTWARKPLLSQ